MAHCGTLQESFAVMKSTSQIDDVLHHESFNECMTMNMVI